MRSNYSAIFQLVLANGYWLLPCMVLVEQIGVPIPAAAALIVMGSLTRDGYFDVWTMWLLSALAAFAADTVWYRLGMWKGSAVLRFVCRLSLEPDICMRSGRQLLRDKGAPLLLVAKFVPVMSAVVTPMAGMDGMGWRKFALLDFGGCLLWAGAYLWVGRLLDRQVHLALDAVAALGRGGLVLLAALLAGYVALQVWNRRRYAKVVSELEIDPLHLRSSIESGSSVLLVDLRHKEHIERVIPTAQVWTPAEARSRLQQSRPESDVILYCG